MDEYLVVVDEEGGVDLTSSRPPRSEHRKRVEAQMRWLEPASRSTDLYDGSRNDEGSD